MEENRTERLSIYQSYIFYLGVFVATHIPTLTIFTTLFLKRESKHHAALTPSSEFQLSDLSM